MLIDANLSMMSSSAYCVTRAGSTSSSGSCSASTSSLAASVTELVWLINGWRFTRPVDLVSIELTVRQNEYILIEIDFSHHLLFPPPPVHHHIHHVKVSTCWFFEKEKREKQGNIDPAGKEGEKARRKRDREKWAGNKSLVAHSAHTGRDGGISYFIHATKEYRIITEIEYRSLLACWGRKMCSAQSYAEIGSRWNRNYFFHSLLAHNMSGSSRQSVSMECI